MKVNKQLLSMLGLVLLVLGFSMLFPMILGFYDGEVYAKDLGLLAVIGIFGGFMLFKIFHNQREIEVRTAYLLVALSWLLAGLYGSIPYIILDVLPNFSQAFFETISGFSTTGSTVFADVESLPRSILLWRSMTQWLGGMGIVVLFVALLSFYGNSGLKMYRAESTGPIKEKVVPRMRETAKILWLTYVIITICGIFILWLLGMPIFDAVCHSFATVATGGFSIKNNSIAFYNSNVIEIAITLYMALAGVSFGLFYQFFKKRSWQPFKQNSEFKLYISIMASAIIICTIGLLSQGVTFGQALLDGAFQVASLMTTTGYMTKDYLLWPYALQFALIIVVFVGGCAGSTSGGIKVGRFLIMGKNIKAQFRKILHPQAVVCTKINNRPIQLEILLMTLNFFFLYIIIIAIGTFIMTCLGLDILTSFTAVLTALSNVGPAFGELGPTQNFSEIPTIGLNLLSFLMMVGRLELYTILMLFSRGFWRET